MQEQSLSESSNQKTAPFFKVSQKDRNSIRDNLREYCRGNKAKICPELVKTAVKATIGSSDILTVPVIVPLPYGPGLEFRIKGEEFPVLITVAQMRQYVW